MIKNLKSNNIWPHAKCDDANRNTSLCFVEISCYKNGKCVWRARPEMTSLLTIPRRGGDNERQEALVWCDIPASSRVSRVALISGALSRSLVELHRLASVVPTVQNEGSLYHPHLANCLWTAQYWWHQQSVERIYHSSKWCPRCVRRVCQGRRSLPRGPRSWET